jgi:phosphoglucomutase
MIEELNPILQKALQEKKLNEHAHAEIVKWLTEDEFAEFKAKVAEKIKAEDWDFLMDAFYRVLIFGTGGIRGVMDIGTNRINNYMIRWASQAFAQYLIKHKGDGIQRGVAIAYDSRHNSEQFMKETARVLAANGIPVHVYDYFKATPQLSFTVRHLKCIGGIVLTASHNPPQFNGYKVYDEFGIQVLPDVGLQIEDEFKNITQINNRIIGITFFADNTATQV